MAELAFAAVGKQGAQSVTQGVTEYYAPNGRFTAAASQALCSVPWRGGSATAKKFYARVTTNNASAGGTFGLAINGGSSVAVAVTASTTGTFSDTSSTLSLAAGDAIAFTASTAAGTGGITYSGISCAIECPSQAAVVQGTTNANLSTTLGSVSRFYNFSVGTSISATEGIFAQTLFDASVLSNLRVNVSVNQRAANSTAKIRLNGADTSVSVTIPTTTTGVFEDTSNSATGAATDVFNGVFTTGGASNSQTLTINQASLLVTGGSARHTSVFLGVRNTTAQSMTAGATRHHSIVGDIDNNAGPTAAETACPMPFDGSVFAFGINVSANTATTNGVLTLFKNASATAAVATVTSATTGWFTNTSPGVTFSAGDRLGHQWVNGATNATSLVGITTTLQADAVASGGRKRRALVY